MSADTKTVFELRKAGKIDEAYKMAQQLYEAQPDDEWVNKAMFYTLYDKIKAESEHMDNNTQVLLGKQVSQLKLPEDDKAINTCLGIIKRILDPNYDKLQQASEFSKKGLFKKAVDIYKVIIVNYKEDEYVNICYGWDLYRLAKEIIVKTPDNFRECKTCLNYYLKLSNPRPSHLHSSILRLALKLAKDDKLDIVAFAKMWDLNTFDSEDFRPSVFEGKTYPSLAEQAYQELFKELSRNPNHENVEHFSSFLDKAIETFPDNIWLIYYKVKILSSLHENDQALKYMIKVLRKKSSEYWAWKYAGDILAGSDDLERSVSCYCKAMLCTGEEDKLLRVKADFVPILVKSGYTTEAVIEVNNVLASNDDKLKQEISQYQSEPWWVTKLDKKESNKEFYLKMSASASDLLHHDLPWHKAVFVETFRTKQKNKELAKLMIVEEPGKLTETVTSTKNYPVLKKLTPGQAVMVKYTIEEGKLNVLGLELRNDGFAWDILPSQIAVVDHINEGKNIVHCISINRSHISYGHRTGQKDMLRADSVYGGVIRLTGSNEVSMFEVGMPLEIRAFSKVSSKGIILDIRGYTKLEPDATDSDLVMSFSGNVRINDYGYGFVDNVFIHASMVSEHQLVNSDQVHGRAIRKFVKRENAWGWHCFRID
ncbi:MAG TPA: hypothetical protein PKN54_00865 [Candidatus Cloacimonas acidaminovorans]|jgi:tetratricopeptide (TPR) repeat protein|nr:hypothetical protein [Candidatus Cloacimonas acidaminovorans]HNZ88170.1 hypothetical protein [Candidatus Cloacimonas acidaminovorans]HOI01275.1 hypothetical protein [Candidatus Cloacimonas acidaminovorans]HPU99389.1 hypothetical protein [Candidatus Cloacimonas acidaminovorans]